VTGVSCDPPPPQGNWEGMGMGMGIHGEWQTCNDSLPIRECHSPNGKGNDQRWSDALLTLLGAHYSLDNVLSSLVVRET